LRGKFETEKKRVQGEGSADAPEMVEERRDYEYEDKKEEVGGMAGALLASADLGMSWEEVGEASCTTMPSHSLPFSSSPPSLPPYCSFSLPPILLSFDPHDLND
jgi:hypothetical protein